MAESSEIDAINKSTMRTIRMFFQWGNVWDWGKKKSKKQKNPKKK